MKTLNILFWMFKIFKNYYLVEENTRLQLAPASRYGFENS